MARGLHPPQASPPSESSSLSTIRSQYTGKHSLLAPPLTVLCWSTPIRQPDHARSNGCCKGLSAIRSATDGSSESSSSDTSRATQHLRYELVPKMLLCGYSLQARQASL